MFLTAIVLGPRLTPGRFCLPLTLPEIVNGDADAGIRDTQRSCFRRAVKWWERGRFSKTSAVFQRERASKAKLSFHFDFRMSRSVQYSTELE